MTKKIYYKVCRTDNGGKHISFKKDDNFIPLQYIIGTVTKPRCGDGPCCVFDCIGAAIAFLNNFADIRFNYCIMECTITKSKSVRVWQKGYKCDNGTTWKSGDVTTCVPNTVLGTQVVPQKIIYTKDWCGVGVVVK